MTDKDIVKRAKDAEKRTRFGELVHSPVSNGVNSAYGIGFIEGMVEYRNSLQEEPVSEDLDDAANNYGLNVRKGYPRVMDETDRYIYNAFKAGAKWADKSMADKAIEVEIVGLKKQILDGSCGYFEIEGNHKEGDK